MMKKIMSIFLAVSILFSFSIVCGASDSSLNVFGEKNSFQKMIPTEVQEDMANQTEALEKYSELMEFFDKDKFGVPIYPENYAGEYIDGNNKLVVQITESFANKEILEYLKKTPVIQIKHVEHSYNELLAQKEVANELYASGVRVASDGVDIINNRYEITVLEGDLEKIPSVYAKNSIISIKKGEYAKATAQLVGGNKIHNEDKGEGYMTLGICGTYGGKKAILTCGHGNEEVGLFPRYPYIQKANFGDRIGQVVFQQANTNSNNYGVSSLGDFAIVEVTSSDTTTNRVLQGGQITGTYSSVPVGTILYKYGATTYYSWGTVTGTSMRITYSGDIFNTYTVDGLYSVAMQNSSGTTAIDGGDSGGPVWRSDTGENLLHGIVTAKLNGTNTMYTTPIYYAEYQGFQPRFN